MANFKIPSNEELIFAMQNVPEEVADTFMSMALEDVKKIPEDASSVKQELAYKLYRAYLIGYCIALKQNQE